MFTVKRKTNHNAEGKLLVSEGEARGFLKHYLWAAPMIRGSMGFDDDEYIHREIVSRRHCPLWGGRITWRAPMMVAWSQERRCAVVWFLLYWALWSRAADHRKEGWDQSCITPCL